MIRIVSRSLKGVVVESRQFHVKRCQSSFTFVNNQSLITKQQLKQSKKQANKKETSGETRKEGGEKCISSDSKKEKVNRSGKQKRDYSWFPVAPKTEHLKEGDIAVDLLYSGYRPLSLRRADPKEAQSKIYELAMRLEAVEDPLPWVKNATGRVLYDEWDNVPQSVIRNLRPYVPPKVETKEKTDNDELIYKKKKELLQQAEQKYLNRSRGRRRPVVGLLHLRRKLEG
ncbi:Pet20p Ecym_2390 [Eremothecium cymbalariae DBVPG|uniref:Uncharacterized protein n=1 Tax=Eremothecium cymbalariae (strain CBS 270.75 / DBVPG 7215 / KCTC 17166 / NRRL Y-17582) TaxID=931890 RepID=G8JNQ5_ERECY|nr:Hypothetical protein Ecym_2390 [Eremothecium cymbalariae DBVPG\